MEKSVTSKIECFWQSIYFRMCNKESFETSGNENLKNQRFITFMYSSRAVNHAESRLFYNLETLCI